jgi:hypothetical protein
MRRKTIPVLLITLLATSCASDGFTQEELDAAVAQAVSEVLATSSTVPADGAETTTTEGATAASSAPTSTTSTNTQAPTATTSAELAESDPRSADAISGNSSPPLAEGEPDVLSVVQAAHRDSGFGSTRVFVVVRNNTSESVKGIEVAFTVRDKDGGLLASGDSSEMYPYRVGPAEISFGSAYLSDVEIPPDARFDFQVGSSDTSERYDDRVDLIVAEHGKPGDSVVGILDNNTEWSVQLAQAGVMCFLEDGSITWFDESFSDEDSIAAGGTGSVTVDLRGNECPIYLVASRAWSED